MSATTTNYQQLGQGVSSVVLGLKPYLEYKDSGLPWLGHVPGHWDIRRIKYLLREIDSRSTSGKEQLLRVSQYTGVTQRKSVDGSDEPDTRAASLVGYKKVCSNDLVINIMLAWNGSMGVSRYEGIASPAYCVYRFNKDALPWYFHELLRSPVYKGRIKVASTGVVESRLRLYSEELGRVEAILPPLDEQAAIVRFLDHATHRLDKAIRAKRKIIALLNEQKQAIIHRAVTRGLDPDVPLKDSGIPWLGQIPVHWVVRKLGTLGIFFKGRGIARADITETGVPAITYGDIYTRYGIEAKALSKCTSPEVAANAQEILNGDLLFTASGETIEDIGKTTLFSGDVPGYAGGDIIILRLDEGEGLYLSYALNSSLGVQQKSAFGRGDIIVHISASKLKQVVVPLPPQEQQIAIAQFLDQSAANITGVIDRATREIELLREYRTRLIADVVTGKLDVREAAAHLPEVESTPADEPELAEMEESGEELAEESA